MRAVIGQRRLLDRLGAQAAQGDVAHAYGLFGPRGIGKRTIALRLAQTLNCTEADRPAGGCGRCRACGNIDQWAHPDVRLIQRDYVDKKEKTKLRKVITIDQILEIQSDLSFRPLEGRKRVIIIDDAAELSDEAQSSLLKTLEEPPPHTVLLLLTEKPAMLNETIRSRMQMLPFRLVATAEIAAGLQERFGAGAERYAAPANGRPGLGIDLAANTPGVRAARAAFEGELYRLIGSGLTDRFAWAAELADDNDTSRRTEAIDERFGHWSELLRDAAVAARGLADRPLRPDRAAQTGRLAAAVTPRELVDAVLLIGQLRRDLDWNANARAMLELFTLKLPYVSGIGAAA